MQTMDRELREPLLLQEVPVWAQTWLPALHTVLLYELEKVPFSVGWDGVGFASAPVRCQGSWPTEASVLGGS